MLPNTPPTTKQQPEDVDDNDPLIHRHQNICGNEARWVSPFTEIPIRIVTHSSRGGGGGIQNTRLRRRWREEQHFVSWWFIRESSIGSEPHDSQDLIDSWPTPPPPAPSLIRIKLRALHLDTSDLVLGGVYLPASSVLGGFC